MQNLKPDFSEVVCGVIALCLDWAFSGRLEQLMYSIPLFQGLVKRRGKAMSAGASRLHLDQPS